MFALLPCERQIMNFPPKINDRPVVRGILTIVAVVGLIGWISHIAPAVQEPLQTSANVPAVEMTPAPGLQAAKPDYYQPISWYNSKHWWKRNAPIVGGAAGGALIGGLAGGGKGALIGGAVGGGGGYLYKRSRHSHNHNHSYRYRQYH